MSIVTWGSTIVEYIDFLTPSGVVDGEVWRLYRRPTSHEAAVEQLAPPDAVAYRYRMSRMGSASEPIGLNGWPVNRATHEGYSANYAMPVTDAERKAAGLL